MLFKLEIKCDNDAFLDGNGTYEVSNLLHQAAVRVGTGEREGSLRDSNGTTVASFGFVE